MPPLLIVLSLLMLAMIVVAVGVMFNVLPAWSTHVESPAHRLVVTPNRILPILSSIVGIVFVTTIFRRYAQRGGTHLFVWGIGLAFFATGSMTESLHGLLGWNEWVFRFWYLFGAVLIAAWMGQGTMHLLAPGAADHGVGIRHVQGVLGRARPDIDRQSGDSHRPSAVVLGS